MKTPIFMGFALALAAPVYAQTTAPGDTAVPAPIPAAEAPAAPAAAAPTDPAGIIKAEFPAYDKDANGTLNKLEMSTWLKALNTASPDPKPMAAADETKWLDTSFTAADADKSASVTVAELTNYLTKGS